MHPRYGRRLPLTAAQGLFVARASWTVPAATVVSSMTLHAFSGPRAIPFFISETDHLGPQDTVFTLGLTLTGLLQMLYAWHLYHTLEAERPRMWLFSTLVGIFAAMNTVLVSHLDMYDFINPHIATAMFAFGGGLIWVLLAQRALGDNAVPRGRALRRFGFLTALTGFIVMVISFQWAAAGVDSANLTTEAFLNEAQIGINIAAPAEYVLVAGLLFCLASFRAELVAAIEPSTNQQDYMKRATVLP